MRQVVSIKETPSLSLQDLNKTVNEKTFWRTLNHQIATPWK